MEIKYKNLTIYPYEGIITRGFKNGSVKECGCYSEKGYLRFKQDNKILSNHRFIFEKFHKVILNPNEFINHKNFKKDDNRIDNLEVVSNQENTQWSKKYKTNTSGYKNISKHKNGGWTVNITVSGKKQYHGYFKTLKDAIEKRDSVIDYLNSQGHKYYKDYHNKLYE